MSAKLFRRCGCRDDARNPYATLPEGATAAQKAKACPRLLTDSRHGAWNFRLSAGNDPATGARRQVSGSAYGGPWERKADAAAARDLAEVKLRRGSVPAREVPRLADYLDAWIERRAAAAAGASTGKPLSPASLDNYRRYIRRDIGPSSLGSMKLRDVRRRHVQAFIDELLADGRGAVTIRRIVAVLQGAMKQAVQDELIDETPARLLELPATSKKEFRPWEPDEVGTFLDVAAEHRLGILFEVAVFTGLRRGELLGLTWDDVDLERREIRVRRTTTKTDAGRRRVALDDRAVGALVAWSIAQAAERDAAGVAWVGTTGGRGHVFTYEDGRPVKPHYATRLFQKLRAQAGLPDMTFHGQRHQQASLQLAAGTPLAVVSKRLGHASVAITADVYSHLLESTEREAANAAASLVPARRPRPGDAAAHAIAHAGGENTEETAPTIGGNGL